MKAIQISLIIVLITACSSNKPIIDNEGNLYGITHKKDFMQPPFKAWFDEEYNAYKLDDTSINALEPLLKNYSLEVFMGTWCGDSRREVPRLYKILNAVHFDYSKMELYTVNHDKKTVDNMQEGKRIDYVPTIIIYKDQKEIGRIVESPIETLEKDLLIILKGEVPYLPNYSN